MSRSSTGRVTRLVVIDDTGRVYDRWGVGVRADYQDDGQTLKLFVHPPLSEAQRNAVRWLRGRGGDGHFDRYGSLTACGERAPFRRVTWNGLRDLGYVEFYKPDPDAKGAGRLRLTPSARGFLGLKPKDLE